MSIFISRRSFILSSLASTLIQSTLFAKTEDKDFPAFSFVFVSDCHLTTSSADNYMLLQESQLFLQEAVKQINLLKPDFVIFGGDQIQGLGDNDTNWQLFLDIAQGLDSSWYFVLGESDISGSFPVNKMNSYGRDWKGKGLENNNSYWSTDPVAGVHLIGLDTSQANTTVGYVDESQLAWLENDLSKDNNRLTILASHHPLLVSPPLDKANAYLLPQADSIRNILEKSGNKIIALNGHMHISKIQYCNNIWYISSPGLDVYPCAFRFFKVNQEKVEVETYRVNFPALVKKAKTNLLNSNIANCFGLDRSEKFVKLATGSKADEAVCLSLKGKGVLSTYRRTANPAP